MFQKLLTKNLLPQEKLIDIIREYYIVYWWQAVLSIVLILLPFFLLYLLFSYRFWGILLFFILLFSGIFIGIRALYLYYLNAIIITDTRIINYCQKGLFHRAVDVIDFDNINDISYNKKGLFATIFNFGNIIIHTNNEKNIVEIKRIKLPDEIREKIHGFQKFSQNQNEN